MAKYKQGQLGILIGRIGNTSYYNSPLGPIVRTRNIPHIRKTESGDLTHKLFKFSLLLWSKLTLAQVQAWNNLAYSIKRKDKAGNILHWRGRDLFCKVNRNRLEMKLPCIFDPPQKIYPKALSKFEVDIIGTRTVNDITLHFKPAIDKNTKINIHATCRLELGKHSVKPCWYRKIGVIDYRFKSGDSIMTMYDKIFPKQYLTEFRIAFLFRPVSAISGLTGAEFSILESPIS